MKIILMLNKENRFCRVCGFEQEDLPWGEDGNTPSFAICDCCGVEFGYEDTLLESVHTYREKWLEKKANWSNTQYKPQNWDLAEQLKKIPEEYL